VRGDRTEPLEFESPLGLPRVTGVEVSRVKFDPPKRFYSRGLLVEHRQAVQLLVRTTGPLPVRDLTPVIFIGDEEVNEYDEVGVNLYRFLVYDLEKLRAGATVALGWPFAPEAKIPTDFHFNLSPPPIA
jgi:hypothetical protein